MQVCNKYDIMQTYETNLRTKNSRVLHSRPRNAVWMFSAITAIVSYIVMLTITIPCVQYFANGEQVPDLLPMGYSSGYLYSFLNIIGEEGRNAYLIQLGIDVIYPFSLSYVLYIGFSRYFADRKNLARTITIALTWSIMIFDYLENLMIFLQIFFFPDPIHILGTMAPVFSIIKSMATTITSTLAIFVLIRKLIEKYR